MVCSPPVSSVHRILQARISEWVAIPFSRGSSQPKVQTFISYIAGRFFTTEPPGKLQIYTVLYVNYSSVTLEGKKKKKKKERERQNWSDFQMEYL